MQQAAEARGGPIDLLLVQWSAERDVTGNGSQITKVLSACDAYKQLGVVHASLDIADQLDASQRQVPVCNLVELHPAHSQRKLVGTLLRKVRSPLCDDVLLSHILTPAFVVRRARSP